MSNVGFALIFNSSLNEEPDENLYIERRFLRDRYNVLDLPTQKFLESFRVSKDIFKYLIHQIRPHMNLGTRITKIPIEIKLAAVLNFYATGSSQKPIRDAIFHNVDDQNILSKAITEISCLLERTICKQFIKFPDTRAKIAYKQKFLQKTGHPGVIGCIDCTRIDIQAPRENGHIFVDRRGNHSMNVQLICNYDLQILSVCATFPGSTHKSEIWEVSQDKKAMKCGFDIGEHNTWLLGDSGYPLEPYLIKPYQNPNQRQILYNNLHAKARMPMGRCIGILKNTFRCLLGELHFEPKTVVKIVNVCTALYNICLQNKLQMIDLPRPEEGDETTYEAEFEYEDMNEYENAVKIRDRLLNCSNKQ